MCGYVRAKKAIQHECYIIPSIEDIIAELNGATIFSKLDLNATYHQVELAPEHPHLTSWCTHVGFLVQTVQFRCVTCR